MKKLLVIIAVVVFFTIVSSFTVFAKGANECTPAGTWYGGSYYEGHAGYKYHYTFTPTQAGRFFAMADGAYYPDSLGVAIITTWTGEMVEKSGGSYEIRLIGISLTDPNEPSEESPMIWAGKGDVQFDGCDKMTIEYNFFAIYEWDKVPFVDDPVTWVLYSGDDPIVETIKRMHMGTELPVPPPRPES